MLNRRISNGVVAAWVLTNRRLRSSCFYCCYECLGPISFLLFWSSDNENDDDDDNKSRPDEKKVWGEEEGVLYPLGYDIPVFLLLFFISGAYDN